MRLDGKARGRTKEIIIVSFVIALLLLVSWQAFSGQIVAKTKALKTIAREEEAQRQVEKARKACQETCDKALEEDCRDSELVQFCITYIAADIDGNGRIGDYDETLLQGTGLCEDRIYCPQLAQCRCYGGLTMKQCMSLLCDFWKAQGMESVEKRSESLRNYLAPGVCDYRGNANHWYLIASEGKSDLACKT
jgi:hypothetical protein